LLPNPNKRPHALLDLFVKERCLFRRCRPSQARRVYYRDRFRSQALDQIFFTFVIQFLTLGQTVKNYTTY